MVYKKGYKPWNKGMKGYKNAGSFTSERMRGNKINLGRKYKPEEMEKKRNFMLNHNKIHRRKI
jgi:formylmethanofuran dehydrogenase subunit A